MKETSYSCPIMYQFKSIKLQLHTKNTLNLIGIMKYFEFFQYLNFTIVIPLRTGKTSDRQPIAQVQKSFVVMTAS